MCPLLHNARVEVFDIWDADSMTKPAEDSASLWVGKCGMGH